MPLNDIGDIFDRGETPAQRDEPLRLRCALKRYAVATVDALRERLRSSSGSGRSKDYRISIKMLMLAMGLEVSVATIQWYGADLMAVTFAGGNWIQHHQMMLAPSLYAVAEMCRVPLAIAFRTHKSVIMRGTALLGALLSALITIKSSAQIGEQMYRARLHEVRTAQLELSKTQAADQSLDGQIVAAVDDLRMQQERFKEAQASVDDARSKLAQLPPPACWTVAWVDSEGRARRGRRCSADPRNDTLTAALQTAETWYASANDKLTTAKTTWAEVSAHRPSQKAAVADAQAKEATAVMDSQIHSFTGMLFRKGPNEVSEPEIYTFLQLFVFIPSLVISLVGFVLACASVSRLPPTHIVLDRKTARELRKHFRT